MQDKVNVMMVQYNDVIYRVQDMKAPDFKTFNVHVISPGKEIDLENIYFVATGDDKAYGEVTIEDNRNAIVSIM